MKEANRVLTPSETREFKRLSGIVPELVALQQIAWIRRDQAYRMHEAGLTCKEIGQLLKISSARAGQLVEGQARRQRRGALCPVELYMAQSITPNKARAKRERRALLKGCKLVDAAAKGRDWLFIHSAS